MLLKRIIYFYYLELCKMDVEVASVIKKKKINGYFPQPDNIQELWCGFIQKDP